MIFVTSNKCDQTNQDRLLFFLIISMLTKNRYIINVINNLIILEKKKHSFNFNTNRKQNLFLEIKNYNFFEWFVKKICQHSKICVKIKKTLRNNFLPFNYF